MRVFSWIIAGCGLWEFGDIAAVFTPGFGTIQSFVWNHIAIGLIWLVAGVWAGLTKNADTVKRLHWLSAVAGVWLILATLILRNPANTPGLWNDISVGAIAFLAGVWNQSPQKLNLP